MDRHQTANERLSNNLINEKLRIIISPNGKPRIEKINEGKHKKRNRNTELTTLTCHLEYTTLEKQK